MSALAIWTVALGAAKFFGSLAMLLAPGTLLRAMRAAPRHAWTGRVLATAALLWAAWALRDMPMGFLDQYKWLLWPLTPAAIVLVCIYLDELLTVRALGGLYLLMATPLLAAVRAHPSPARLIMSLLAYIIIVAGAFFVMMPYTYRKMVEWAMPDERRARLLAPLGMLFGAALIVLGLVAY